VVSGRSCCNSVKGDAGRGKYLVVLFAHLRPQRFRVLYFQLHFVIQAINLQVSWNSQGGGRAKTSKPILQGLVKKLRSQCVHHHHHLLY
jgi:hypothetical protein